MLDRHNPSGERAFFYSILNQAIYDALGYRKPKAPIIKENYEKYERRNKFDNPDYVSTDPEYLAWDARRFISMENDFFCSICHLLDINPKYLVEKVKKQIKRYDNGSRRIFKRRVD